ncbi:MAG: tRNA modification GTPase [Arenicella sp.]|jgi:tRNA modification GTPase
MQDFHSTDTIIALSTPPGIGAIGVLRVSGANAISKTNELFKGKNLETQESHTIHFGTLREGKEIVDEVLVSLFVGPNSYTGENVVEISCHGSEYIIQRIIRIFGKLGVRYAKAGEFTRRAFLNGKFDLAQAEAVADLISSDSEVSHRAAMNQMRGGFSEEIKVLRERLVHFASMIELELDFSEEDVEFANREELKNLILDLQAKIQTLADSFKVGNVIKNGVPTVIAGKPNAGKSTLLNALLNEEKAIVSAIAGTTRDFIEDEMNIEGIGFRFIDTAGLREAQDEIEAIGVERAKEKMKSASLILYVLDMGEVKSLKAYEEQLEEVKSYGVPFIMVGNKAEFVSREAFTTLGNREEVCLISAKTGDNLEVLKTKILERINLPDFKAGNTIVTNARHYESLVSTQQALEEVIEALDNGVTGDFLALDIRNATYQLGEITGQITTDDLLGNIFSKFCIGK